MFVKSLNLTIEKVEVGQIFEITSQEVELKTVNEAIGRLLYMAGQRSIVVNSIILVQVA